LSEWVESEGVEQEKLTVENEAVERLAEEGFSLGKQNVRRTEWEYCFYNRVETVKGENIWSTRKHRCWLAIDFE
jgi:hypothetical protein